MHAQCIYIYIYIRNGYMLMWTNGYPRAWDKESSLHKIRNATHAAIKIAILAFLVYSRGARMTTSWIMRWSWFKFSRSIDARLYTYMYVISYIPFSITYYIHIIMVCFVLWCMLQARFVVATKIDFKLLRAVGHAGGVCFVLEEHVSQKTNPGPGLRAS